MPTPKRHFHALAVVLVLALGLAACDPPTKAVLLDDGGIRVFVVERKPDRLDIVAEPATHAAFVDVHYRIDGGPQQNVRMTREDTRWRHVLHGLQAGDVVDLFVTYEHGDAATDTAWLRHVFVARWTGPTPTAGPTATPRPSASPAPTATVRPSPTPPGGSVADEPLTPTDYVHRIVVDGERASIEVLPLLPLGSSTVTYRIDGGSKQSVSLTRDGDRWRAPLPAGPGQEVEYSFFLSFSDGSSPLYLRSATRRATVGAPPSPRAPLVVETAGRFRDRHENERRHDPFIAGYFEASTFEVVVLDFGDAVDFTVRVADETEFVDIKLFDRDPTLPHERSPEVRADYRVAARMLAYDDPSTGVRTHHWRQERNDVLAADLAPGMLVDFEFTIRRAQTDDVHEGSNGQYYTAIFRHRIGEPGLTELLPRGPARPGGDASVYVFSEPEWSFAQAARNLDHDALLAFLRGKHLFDRDLLAAGASAGLGPRYDATSCEACHPRDGSAAPPDGPRADGPGLTVGLSAPGTDLPHPAYGAQLQRRAVPGTSPEGRLEILWDPVSGTFADGSPYQLVAPTPRLTDLAYGPLDGAGLSLRIAPRLVGMGLLEAVPADALLGLADENDVDGDGISGRARIVWDEARGVSDVGRFGWKARSASLAQQVARAFLLDLGVTTPVFPFDDETPASPAIGSGVELTEGDLEDVSSYVATLGVPLRLDEGRPEVEAGFDVFVESGCAACHQPTLETGADARDPALRHQVIHPFTDLLLHDMGPGLADADGGDPGLAREWRTAPLWGLGRTGAVSGHTRFLHDGRARSLLEAILWHDGEARAARDRVRALDPAARNALLRFLGSL